MFPSSSLDVRNTARARCHRFFLLFGFVGGVVEGPALPSPVPGSWVRGWMAFRPRSAMSRLTPCLAANSSGRGEPPTASPATLRRRGFRKIRSIRSTSYSPASCVAAGVVAWRRLPLGSSSTLQIGHAQCPVSGGGLSFRGDVRVLAFDFPTSWFSSLGHRDITTTRGSPELAPAARVSARSLRWTWFPDPCDHPGLESTGGLTIRADPCRARPVRLCSWRGATARHQSASTASIPAVQ